MNDIVQQIIDAGRASGRSGSEIARMLATAQSESGMNPGAVGDVRDGGAFGPFQFNYGAGRLGATSGIRRDDVPGQINYVAEHWPQIGNPNIFHGMRNELYAPALAKYSAMLGVGDGSTNQLPGARAASAAGAGASPAHSVGAPSMAGVGSPTGAGMGSGQIDMNAMLSQIQALQPKPRHGLLSTLLFGPNSGGLSEMIGKALPNGLVGGAINGIAGLFGPDGAPQAQTPATGAPQQPQSPGTPMSLPGARPQTMFAGDAPLPPRRPADLGAIQQADTPSLPAPRMAKIGFDGNGGLEQLMSMFDLGGQAA